RRTQAIGQREHQEGAREARHPGAPPRREGRGIEKDPETDQEGLPAGTRSVRHRHLQAMYLAGLIADDRKMTKKDLEHWVDQAKCPALCGFTVAWVAAESLHGWDLAREWIESKKENTAVTGWATLSSLVAIKDDADLDLAELKRLLSRVQKALLKAPNRVRHAMNNFVIALGTYVQSLSDLALQTALKIGEVSVDLGDTACKVPYAPAYIEKVQKKGAVGKKRKTAKC